jgi:hypothetical protein
MSCPECESGRVSHPRYGAIPGGRRVAVVRVCLDCHSVIPARKAA